MKKIALLSLIPAMFAGYSQAGDAPLNVNVPTELARIFDSNKASVVTHPQNVLCSQCHQSAEQNEPSVRAAWPQG